MKTGTLLLVHLLEFADLLLAGANSVPVNASCKNYTVLNETGRAQGNVLRPYFKCDKNLTVGWYRFQGAAGDRMPEKCVLMKRCGTKHPGWLSGAHPDATEDFVTREVCYSGPRDCCAWNNTIKVKNCSGYYVYELQKTPSRQLRYCGNAGALDGCKNYTVLSEADRLSHNNRRFRKKDLVTGWYRLQGPARDRLADKCVLKGRSGTDFSGYLTQTHPTVTEGVVTRQVCFSRKRSSCFTRYLIKVKNCSSYYVYELQNTVVCKILRSCGNKSAETRESIATLVTEFTSKLDRLDVRRNDSLQEAVGLFQNITKLWRNIDSNDVQERKESIFKIADSFEGFVLNYSHHHLSESTPKIEVFFNSLDLAIQRGYRDFFLEESGRQASIKVSSTNFYKNETIVVGVAYKDLHELFVTNHSNNPRHDISRIVAVKMDPIPKPDKLKADISLNFRHLKVGGGERLCVFWSGFGDKSPDGWSREGCHAVKLRSNAEETECSCNHITHFAVLFHYSNGNSKLTKADEKILRILTYVGLALSITGVTLTIISYAFVTDVHQPLSQIRISLAGSLGAGQMIFLAGIGAKDSTGACVTVAALLQYFLMAAFCWMLVEGIYLYLLVVKVYNIENKMRIYHVMSWGFSAVVVTVSLIIAAGNDGIHSFVDDKYCWMSSDNNLNWIFVAIVVVIEIVNLLILVRVIKEVGTMQPTAGEKHNHQIRLGIRACLVMSPLLGITWLFGLLMPLHKAFAYIFTVLNSTQGFLIFVLHCAKNSQFRERFKRKLNVIFPTGSDANPTRKTSKVNPSDVGTVGKIEVHPCSGVFELEEL